MMRSLRVLVMIAAALLLAGCSQIDPDQARLCRIAAVALVGTGEAVTVRRQTLLAGGAGEAEVRVDFETGAPVRRGFASCRFAARGLGQSRLDLIAVRTESGSLSPVSLFILKRFWLESTEAEGADPQPIDHSAAAPTIPAPLAYGLQHLLNALPAMAAYGMLAAAYSLVYGLIGRINLAFGEFAAIGGAGGIWGAAQFATHPIALVLATVAAALWAASLHGYAVGRLVFLPLRRATGQQALVATVGLALVLNEYLRIAQGAAPAYIAPLRTAPLAVARSGPFIVTVTPLSLVLAGGFGAAAAGVLVLLRKSQFGRNWRAMSDDAQAAAMLGVDPIRMFGQTFVLASALAGAAGATVVLVYGSFGSSLGTTLGLKALLAAVLGGIGSVPGAFLGGLLLGLVEAGWSAYFPIEYRDLIVFIMLAVALVIRPGGFLGYAELGPRRV